MALQNTGQLKLGGEINLEINGGANQDNISLRSSSAAAGFSVPDAMSEFHGYSSSLVLFDSGDTKDSITGGWTYDQCFCGSANGSGTITSSYMEIYAPWWGGGGFTTNNTIDLTSATEVVVDYTLTGGIGQYLSFSVTTGHNGTNPTGTQLITGGPSPQQVYSSGASIPVNFSQPSTIALSLGNASGTRVRITKIEFK